MLEIDGISVLDKSTYHAYARVCFAAFEYYPSNAFNSLTTKKADDKIFVCKFSKKVRAKLYHIENSKTRGQTV